jgi:hypothetical protein
MQFSVLHRPIRFILFVSPDGLGSLASSLILKLWILWTVGRTPWTGDQRDARPLPNTNTNTEQTKTDIQASSGIPTHDLCAWEANDISRLSQSGHCDRPSFILPLLEEDNYLWIIFLCNYHYFPCYFLALRIPIFSSALCSQALTVYD